VAALLNLKARNRPFAAPSPYTHTTQLKTDYTIKKEHYKLAFWGKVEKYRTKIKMYTLPAISFIKIHCCVEFLATRMLWYSKMRDLISELTMGTLVIFHAIHSYNGIIKAILSSDLVLCIATRSRVIENGCGKNL
jgi:hypothetical protein